MEDYDLVQLLGDGGQGQVYRARHQTTGREVAVKVMRCRDQPQVNIALKEIKVLIQLRHEHIVSYTDFLLHFDQFGPLKMRDGAAAPSSAVTAPALVSVCLVMALCTEGTVADKVAQAKAQFMETGEHPIAEARLVRWMRQCALALQYMHSRGFLHRDLKPANIFFHKDDVRLGDFGVATTAREFGTTSHVGTPYYFAPELLLRQPYDAMVDVWGLGLTLLELCTLRERAINTQVLETPSSVDTVIDDVVDMGFSREVATLIRDMLLRDPRARPTPAAILQRLAALSAVELAPVDGEPEPLLAAIQHGSLGDAPPQRPSPPNAAPSSSAAANDCDLCEVYPAEVRCEECGGRYCAACDELRHKSARRTHHHRLGVNTPTAGGMGQRLGSLTPSGADEHPASQGRAAAARPAARPAVGAIAEPAPLAPANTAAGNAQAGAQAPSGSRAPDERPVPVAARAGASKENAVPVGARRAVAPMGTLEFPDPPSGAASRGTSPVSAMPPLPLPQASQPVPPSSAGSSSRTLYVPSTVHGTLASAVAAATPGTTIVVAAGGTYADPIVLDVPHVTIIGEGSDATRPKIGDGHTVAMHVTAGGCRLTNLSISQAVPRTQADDRPFGLLIAIPPPASPAGTTAAPATVVVENCVLSSTGGNAVGVQGEGTDAIVTRCTVTGASQAGVYVSSAARCTVQHCRLIKCDYAGVLVKRAAAKVTGCTIRHCAQTGIFLHDAASTVEANTIVDNGGCGLVVKSSVNVVVRRNTVTSSGQVGIFLCERSTGSFTENTIAGSTKAGILVKTEASPTMMRNKITGGKETGVYVFDSGQGHFEDNEIAHNANAGILVTSGGDPRVIQNRVHSNAYEGVWVCKQGRGYFQSNDLRRNAKGPKDIGKDGGVRWQANLEE